MTGICWRSALTFLFHLLWIGQLLQFPLWPILIKEKRKVTALATVRSGRKFLFFLCSLRGLTLISRYACTHIYKRERMRVTAITSSTSLLAFLLSYLCVHKDWPFLKNFIHWMCTTCEFLSGQFLVFSLVFSLQWPHRSETL